MQILSADIQFQLSLLNIASLGAAERQAEELEKMLNEQTVPEKN